MDFPSAPGVYINEVDAFPNSIVAVATAVPAFIGYTPKAEYQGVSLYNKPQKITSFAEFQTYFMVDDPAPPADPARQYSPNYYLIPQKTPPAKGNYINISGVGYVILPDPSTIYYLYNSLRFFFINGGGAAYIVSVGGYGPASKNPVTDPAAQIINPNVKLTDLQQGLAALQNEQEPTMYICPDATLLSIEDNASLMQSMLLQAQNMQTAMCIFDVIGGDKPDPVLYVNDIQTFRNSVGAVGLCYGATYYPFINTNIMQPGDIDFTNFFGGDIKQLEPLLNPASNPNPAAEQILNMIQNPPASPLRNSQLQAALMTASITYNQLVTQTLESTNILPPSGAMAGVYTVNDNMEGVWNAPANTGIPGAVSLPIMLTDEQQRNLNIDASGKSINAIRFFNGQGILIWGARTLDGNSQDWRYIPVRRTMTFIEQSIKLIAHNYVFQPNNADTWAAVKSAISDFLTNLWKQGGLQGSTPESSFTVAVGLGTTMTAEDLLNGYMSLSVKVAVVRPAEFMVISFQQQQVLSD